MKWQLKDKLLEKKTWTPFGTRWNGFSFSFFFRFVPVLFRIRYISLTISYQHVLLILWDRWNYGENRQNFPLLNPYFKMKHEVHCVKLVCILHDCAVTFVYFSVFVIRSKLAIWTKIVITGDKKIIWWLQPGTNKDIEFL